MRSDVESRSEDREDVVWLKQQVVALFKDAKTAAEVDHAVCVKYAEILLKLMPRAGVGGGQDVSKAVAAARQALAEREPTQDA
jgi:hypothetical protein